MTDTSRRLVAAVVLTASVSGTACRSSSEPAQGADTATGKSTPISSLVRGAVESLGKLLNGASTKAPAVPTFPEGVILGGECPSQGPSARSDIDAQASARIPLKAGLTLSNIWKRASDGNFEHECLTQVKSVGTAAVDVTASCSQKDAPPLSAQRRICRTDLANAPVYHTGTSEHYVETMQRTTLFSLPSEQFVALRDTGSVRHHYLMINTNRTPAAVIADLQGTLKRDRHAMVRVLVNDKPVDLPVIQASGMFDGTMDKQPSHLRITASILDDARFPLVLEYEFVGNGFSIRYTKISFPTERELEKRLSEDESVDVYGVYFDFASDRMRPESAPILAEIAQVMTHHPEWRLAINGHTDKIGGAAANLDLSKRRAAAVKQALETEYHIDGSRFQTDGYGASRPKDTNDTDEGRARNRRVELARLR